jgi:hypothetical protein
MLCDILLAELKVCQSTVFENAVFCGDFYQLALLASPELGR